jgi:hypothetical protein
VARLWTRMIRRKFPAPEGTLEGTGTQEGRKESAVSWQRPLKMEALVGQGDCAGNRAFVKLNS